MGAGLTKQRWPNASGLGQSLSASSSFSNGRQQPLEAFQIRWPSGGQESERCRSRMTSYL